MRTQGQRERNLIMYRLALLLKQFSATEQACFMFMDSNDIDKINKMHLEIEMMRQRVNGSN